MTLAKKLGIGLLMTSSLVGMTYGIGNLLVNYAQIQRLYGRSDGRSEMDPSFRRARELRILMKKESNAPEISSWDYDRREFGKLTSNLEQRVQRDGALLRQYKEVLNEYDMLIIHPEVKKELWQEDRCRTRLSYTYITFLAGTGLGMVVVFLRAVKNKKKP